MMQALYRKSGQAAFRVHKAKREGHDLSEEAMTGDG
jgi:hypothetical protein